MLHVPAQRGEQLFQPLPGRHRLLQGQRLIRAKTFQNTTGVFTQAWGGSGANLFEGGAGEDEFIGGSGPNTFDAGSGFDVLIGGSGANVFNENTEGLGIVSELAQNTVNVPTGSTGSYQVYF